jgi:hypothetical protein
MRMKIKMRILRAGLRGSLRADLITMHATCDSVRGVWSLFLPVGGEPSGSETRLW